MRIDPGQLDSHIVTPSWDSAPTVIATDSTGTEFGTGYGGSLGDGKSHPAGQPYSNTGSLVPMGRTSELDGTPDSYSWFNGPAGLVVNPEIGGVAGRVSRLAYDVDGPATSTTVCNHELTGGFIRPGRPDLARGGPVGTGGDLGQYLAVALAQETYDFPAQDLAQLNVLLGL